MEELKQEKPLETYSNVRLTYQIVYKYYPLRTGINPSEN